MAASNRTWGEERIANELLMKLGIRVSPRTVRRYMPSRPRPKPGTQPWSTFVRNHARCVLASDFFVVVTATFRILYVFVVLEVGTRRILHWNVTAHPTSDWTAQQFRMVISGDEAHRYVIHDRDTIYSNDVDRTIDALGLTVLKTPVHTPQANAFCERVIGTIRRECVDFSIAINEGHVRAILGVGHALQSRPATCELGAWTSGEFRGGCGRRRGTRPFVSSRLPSRGDADPRRSPSRISSSATGRVTCASAISADDTLAYCRGTGRAHSVGASRRGADCGSRVSASSSRLCARRMQMLTRSGSCGRPKKNAWTG